MEQQNQPGKRNHFLPTSYNIAKEEDFVRVSLQIYIFYLRKYTVRIHKVYDNVLTLDYNSMVMSS